MRVAWMTAAVAACVVAGPADAANVVLVNLSGDFQIRVASGYFDPADLSDGAGGTTPTPQVNLAGYEGRLRFSTKVTADATGYAPSVIPILYQNRALIDIFNGDGTVLYSAELASTNYEPDPDAEYFRATFNGDRRDGQYYTLYSMNGFTQQIVSFNYANGGTSGSGSLLDSFEGGEFPDRQNVSFSFNLIGGSTAGSVPEPATWALMILGFGAVGGAMRRRPAAIRRSPAH